MFFKKIVDIIQGVTTLTKGCAYDCQSLKQGDVTTGTFETFCCNTNLCNSAINNYFIKMRTIVFYLFIYYTITTNLNFFPKI